MVPNDRHELMEELNATKESYIKKKLALGGFEAWMRPVVEHFLSELATTRHERWVRAGVCAAIMSAVVALMGFLAKWP